MANTNHDRIPRELWLAAALLASPQPVAAQSTTPFEAALQYFTQTSPDRIIERLDRVRPAAVTLVEKQRVLEGLPPEGDIAALDAGQRRKLAAARRVLALHGREGVYELKVIDVPEAAVALHARVVVLVSEAALDLIDAEELQALVAHEVGHEYFWVEFLRARQRAMLAELEGGAIDTITRPERRR